MALTLKEKELVAVGSSVAAGCKPCTRYHLREARKAEASDAEIHRAVADAASVRSNATEIMEGHGLGRREAARALAMRGVSSSRAISPISSPAPRTAKRTFVPSESLLISICPSMIT